MDKQQAITSLAGSLAFIAVSAYPLIWHKKAIRDAIRWYLAYAKWRRRYPRTTTWIYAGVGLLFGLIGMATLGSGVGELVRR
jgi:hypothetical protein